MSVLTYEFGSGSVHRLGEDPSLGAASSHLPQGAYTTLRTYQGRRVLRLAQHARRLEESLALVGAPASLDVATLRAALGASLRAAGFGESRLRVTFAPPRLVVSVEPFAPLPEALYRRGVSCTTLPLQRENPHSKDTRFIAMAAEALSRLPEGVHEGLLVAADGAILEGLTSNFFGVRAGTLHCEEERALLGVTRSLVLELAEGLLPTSSRAVRHDELAHLAECFLTSASRGILPVVGVDAVPIGDGRPGPVTLGLMRRLDELVAREAESLA